MGILDSGRSESGKNLYANKVKKYLKDKDGKTHVIFLNSFGKFANQHFGVESKVTLQVDEILSLMQEDGYEILDVQFNTIQNQGLTKQSEGYHTLIRYK